MANKRIIDLDAASDLTALFIEVSGSDGISKKTSFVDPSTIVNSVTGTAVDNTDTNNPVINHPYKVYSSRVSTNGGAQVFTGVILENTIGSIVWTRTGFGVYNGQLAGAFLLNKVAGYLLWSNQSLKNTCNVFRVDDNNIEVDVFDPADAGTDNGFFGELLEIRVYP